MVKEYCYKCQELTESIEIPGGDCSICGLSKVTPDKALMFLYLFKVEDIFTVKDRGMIITGRCPFEMESHEFKDELIGKEWGSYTVAGVEAFAKATPPRKNEAIGLLLKGKNEE